MLAQAVVCRCGLDMILRNGVFMCANCDFLQDQEVRCADCDKPGKCESEPGKRNTTVHDRRFELAWVRLIREFFPKPGL